MRRTATLLAALLLPLAACGGTDTKAEPEDSPSTTYKLLPKDQFIQSVNAADIESWAQVRPSQEELLAFPDQWCDGLGAGHSVEWLLGEGGLYPIGQEWGTEKSDAYELVVLGVKAYCLEHTAAVLEELRASGEY